MVYCGKFGLTQIDNLKLPRFQLEFSFRRLYLYSKVWLDKNYFCHQKEMKKTNKQTKNLFSLIMQSKYNKMASSNNLNHASLGLRYTLVPQKP